MQTPRVPDSGDLYSKQLVNLLIFHRGLYVHQLHLLAAGTPFAFSDHSSQRLCYRGSLCLNEAGFRHDS